MVKHAVVVDDDKEIREIVSFVLARYGLEVEEVANGQQLLSILTSSLPDVIILDVMMPGVDGFHICSQLKKDPQTSHIPIVVMTAHAEEIYQRMSADVGADSHITKPFHPLELAEKVVELLQ